jgi:hypothetical protein
MRARVTKLVAALSAVAAFAVGGAALAGASSTPTPTPAPAAPAVPAQSDVQQGDQTAPDLGTSSESSSESATESTSESESATANDGPGGHADEPGNPNADNQFQGEQ